MNKALKDGGKVCTQAESMWLHLDLIAKLVKDASHTFANVEVSSNHTHSKYAQHSHMLLEYFRTKTDGSIECILFFFVCFVRCV
jgi:spermidine synthase